MKYQRDLYIKDYKQLSSTLFMMCLGSEEELKEIKAGQFVNILVENVRDRICRRPISIHDVDYKQNTITVIVQMVGDATKRLSEYKVGERLNVVFPLGNSFPLVDNALLIGGGVGTAPLYYLAKKYKEMGKKVSILIGAKTKQQLFLIDKYREVCDVYISTEDGSMGEKGMVTSNTIINKDFSTFITCGPTPMMKAVSKLAMERNIDCYVSLENRMACGVGACLCCVTDTKKDGNVCVCTEGPVFNAKDLKW